MKISMLSYNPLIIMKELCFYMLISYELSSNSKRIDTWRAFEASWLLPNGQPVTQLCSFTLKQQPHALDSFALKQALNEHNFTSYKSFESWLDSLLGSTKEFFCTELAQAPLKNWPKQPIFYKHLLRPNNVRFICPISLQPFMGQLLLESEEEIDPNAIEWLLLDKRSRSFSPWELTDKLFEQINQISHNHILSVHLARRGGISYQGLRAPLLLERSLEDWMCASTME